MVGPLSSLIIAGVFSLAHLFLVRAGDVIVAVLVQWLVFINVMLALFNLIPGFPLDGGRIFRAFLWMRTGDYSKATRIATLAGRGIGFLFILGGIVIMIVLGQWFTGLWLAFIGWFLENAAMTSYRQALLRDALHGFTVRDVMTVDYPSISREITLGQLVRDYILPTGRRCFLVTKDGSLEGVVTLHNVKMIPQERLDSTSVREIMTPTSQLKVIHPEQSAVSLLELMDEGDVNQLPVVEGSKVIGMVARDGLLHFLRVRTELGI